MVFLRKCIALVCLILPLTTFSSTLSQYTLSLDGKKHDLETVSTGINSTYVFASKLAHQGSIAYKRWDGAKWHPSGLSWHSLGATDVSSAPAAASWEHNYVDIFAVSSTGSLLHKWFNKHSWRPSEFGYDTIADGFLPSSKLAAIAPAHRRLHVFGLAAHSHHLIHKYYDGVSWLPHGREVENLGGKFISGPAVASWGSNRLDVFAVRDDWTIGHKIWDGHSWSQWHTVPLDVSDFYFPVGLTPVVWRENQIDLIGTCVHGHVHQNTWDGTRWVGWKRHGSSVLNSTAVANWGVDKIDIIAQGNNDEYVYKHWDGIQWHPSSQGWNKRGGHFASPPVASSEGSGRLEIFGQNVQGQVLRQGLFDSAWHPGPTEWEVIGDL